MGPSVYISAPAEEEPLTDGPSLPTPIKASNVTDSVPKPLMEDPEEQNMPGMPGQANGPSKPFVEVSLRIGTARALAENVPTIKTNDHNALFLDIYSFLASPGTDGSKRIRLSILANRMGLSYICGLTASTGVGISVSGRGSRTDSRN
jgi:hypothetical protein